MVLRLLNFTQFVILENCQFWTWHCQKLRHNKPGLCCCCAVSRSDQNTLHSRQSRHDVTSCHPPTTRKPQPLLLRCKYKRILEVDQKDRSLEYEAIFIGQTKSLTTTCTRKLVLALMLTKKKKTTAQMVRPCFVMSERESVPDLKQLGGRLSRWN